MVFGVGGRSMCVGNDTGPRLLAAFDAKIALGGLRMTVDRDDVPGLIELIDGDCCFS